MPQTESNLKSTTGNMGKSTVAYSYNEADRLDPKTARFSDRLSHYQTSLCITKRFDIRFICVIKNEVIMKGSPTVLQNSVVVL